MMLEVRLVTGASSDSNCTPIIIPPTTTEPTVCDAVVCKYVADWGADFDQ